MRQQEEQKKTVLVTAIGSFSAEAVIEGCRREGLRVAGCDIYPAEWIVNSKEVDVFYQAPPATDRNAYRAFLKEVCEKEQADFLLPLTDVEVDALHAWDAAADVLGVVICMSGYRTIDLCRDKARMEQFLEDKKLGQTIPGHRLSEVIATEHDSSYAGLEYPVVLKPVDGRSSQGLVMIADARQMAVTAERFEKNADRYLVQPRIPGTVVTVDVVRSSQTKTCVCLPRRELLRTQNGAGTSVFVFRDEALESRCLAIAEALDICGCVNFEFIEHDGAWYFLECNPRFSGGVAFSCMAGYDMIRNHLGCFMGREPEPMGPVWNQYLARRYTEYRMKEEQSDE